MRNLDYIINQINGNREEEIVNEVEVVDNYQEEQYEYSYDNMGEDTIPLWNGYEENESEDGYVEIQFENDFYEPYNDYNEYQYDNYEDDPFYNSIIDASEYVVKEPIVDNYEFDEIDKMVLGDMLGNIDYVVNEMLSESNTVDDMLDLNDMDYVLDELLDNKAEITFNEKVKNEEKKTEDVIDDGMLDLGDMDYVLDGLLDNKDKIVFNEKPKNEKEDKSGIDMDAIYKYMQDEKRKDDVFNRPADSNETPFEINDPKRDDLVNSVIRENNERMKSSSVDLNNEYETDTSWINDEDLFGVNYKQCIAENENEVYEETDFVEGSFSEWMEQNKSKDDFYLVDESC